jgi:hypothetical protein
MEELYNWLFHYNPYKKHWSVFKREDIDGYFNGTLKNVLKSEKYETLVELITITGGDPVKIKKLFNLGHKISTLINK